MDTTETNRLEEGAVLELRPGVSFSLLDFGKVWILLEGRLDLFLAELRDGEPNGARHHFMRVEAGAPVFGFDMPQDGNFGVIANPAASSRVLCLDPAQLREAAYRVPAMVVPLIDRWIENIGLIVGGEQAPQDFARLEPGADITIDAREMAVLPLSGTVWVHHLAGSSKLLGQDSTPVLAEGAYFPVSRVAWLQCAAQTHLECLNTYDWLKADRSWTGLQTFQEQLYAYLVVRRRREEAKESSRLQLVQEVDAKSFEGALQKLAEPLRTGERDGLESAVAVDPLLHVCQIVGHATGISIPAGLRTQGLAKLREPVTAIAEAAQIRIRQVMLKGRWWERESVPMVGFYESEKRPVALLPKGDKYQLCNPTDGSKVTVNEELAGKLHGLAYVFYRPFPARAITALDLLGFGLRGCEGDVATILLMGVAVGLLSMVTPVLTGIMFDSVIPGAQHRTLWELTLFLVMSALATALFTLTRSLATLRLQSKLEASIQAAVWDRLLALPVPFFRKFTSGDLARRSLGINQIRQILTGPALASIMTGSFSCMSCALMFYYSWRLALIATSMVIVAFVISTLCGWMQVRVLRKVTDLGGRIAGMTLQFINGIPKFRVSGTEGRAFGVWARAFAKQRTLAMRARKISNVLATFNSVFPIMAWAVIFNCAFGSMRSTQDAALTTGEFLAFLAAFVQFSTGTLELSSALTSVLSVVPLYERAKPILTTLPEVMPSRTEPRELTGDIEIHHVSFRYRDEGPLVLRDVSLNILPGQFVAFVGPSGSGKSTLFRLLMGFETPGAGAVYYDGQDLGELDVRAVRRQLGVVLQNARLTTGSIFRNIVGESILTIDDAWDAARRAGLEDDLRSMPMGMHTVVSEGGSGLSGGQRQRLLIARAIVRKPRVLLFDEATSALDNQTQAIVRESLNLLNATRIVIAHRLSTIIHADRICVLDRGSVVEAGTYEELMAQGGLFTQLAKRQLS